MFSYKLLVLQNENVLKSGDLNIDIIAISLFQQDVCPVDIWFHVCSFCDGGPSTVGASLYV